ncbi:MAG TPA: alpha/beta hydrolase [Candidatus Limnocylindrales bacterium]|nr:alpha/beta hydrolase [Candidatus Limnocylindrales bacterium]
MKFASVLLAGAVCAAPLAAQAVDKQDIEFGRPGNHPLYLDLHVPAGPGPFPAAILVHGGGFDEGSRKTNVRPLFQLLADAHYAWFSVDYRMAPEFRFPAAREDMDAAIKWVKAHAAEYKVDPKRIALIGESAGGFMVNYAVTHETPETRVAALVDFYGPVDYKVLAAERRDHPERFNMTSINRHLADGGSSRFFEGAPPDSAAPIHAVHKGMPPVLAIHGTKDDQVPYTQSTMFCDAIRKVGTSCDIITIEGGGHGMGWKDPSMQHWKAEMIAWLNRNM